MATGAGNRTGCSWQRHLPPDAGICKLDKGLVYGYLGDEFDLNTKTNLRKRDYRWDKEVDVQSTWYIITIQLKRCQQLWYSAAFFYRLKEKPNKSAGFTEVNVALHLPSGTHIPEELNLKSHIAFSFAEPFSRRYLWLNHLISHQGRFSAWMARSTNCLWESQK